MNIMTGKKAIDTQTQARAVFTLSLDRPVILTVTTIKNTRTERHIHLGFWSSHAKSFLRLRATGVVISALVKSGLGNLTLECLYMCGQRRPPPQLNVYNNSLQVMPVVIKVKRLARCSETNLSCWSYYSQIKLSCLGQRGCKLWNLNKNTLLLARPSTAIIHRCDGVWPPVYSIHSQLSMWRHRDGNRLKLFQAHNSSSVFESHSAILCLGDVLYRAGQDENCNKE